MIDISDENVPGLFLLLKVALQAQGRVALVQQTLVYRAMRRMTDHTTLTHCFVLVNERAALRGVALEASLVSAQERKAAGFERLLNIGLCAFNSDPFVRLMTIGAAHFAFRHRMMVRQLECCANFQMTLKAGLRRLSRIDDCARSAAALYVQTPRPVTRLAAYVLCVFPLRLQSGVSGCAKIAHDLFVTCRAFF